MFQYIDTNELLEAFLQSINGSKWVALDTEFIREKTYFPKLCLIQIATTDTLACIDPLAINDLSPLWQWLSNTDVVKVFHAAWQDLEIIYQLSGSVPPPVFDTQIAAAVLGIGDQMGYARLIETMLGLQLDKSQSRTDWAKRPLQAKQLDYAIDDVRYLREIYPKLTQQLQQQERSSWLAKSFQQLENPETYEPAPRSCWKRTKGVQLLKPKQLSVLRELAAWREERAIRKNLPRRWLLSDEILIDMARMKNLATEQDLRQIRNLPAEQIKRHGSTWLELIAQGLSLPKEEWPELPRRKKLNENLALTADLLIVVVNKIAREHNISPAMIANRSQIEKMLTEGRNRLSEDWRGNLVNDVFSQILTGRSSIKIEKETVVITESNDGSQE